MYCFNLFKIQIKYEISFPDVCQCQNYSAIVKTKSNKYIKHNM